MSDEVTIQDIAKCIEVMMKRCITINACYDTHEIHDWQDLKEGDIVASVSDLWWTFKIVSNATERKVICFCKKKGNSFEPVTDLQAVTVRSKVTLHETQCEKDARVYKVQLPKIHDGEEILKRAQRMVTDRKKWAFGSFNSEHFVTYAATKEATSYQLRELSKVIVKSGCIGGVATTSSTVSKLFCELIWSKETLEKILLELGLKATGKELTEGGIKEGLKATGKELAEGGIKEGLKATGKELAEGGIKEGLKATGKELAEEGIKEGLKATGKEVAEEGIKEGLKATGKELAEGGIKEGLKATAEEGIKATGKELAEGAAEESVKTVGSGTANSFKAGLIAGFIVEGAALTYTAVSLWKKYQKKEVSLGHCRHVMVKRTCAAGGSIAGSAVGTVIGTALIPIPVLGSVLGGMVGSLTGDLAGSLCGSKLDRSLF